MCSECERSAPTQFATQNVHRLISTEMYVRNLNIFKIECKKLTVTKFPTILEAKFTVV